MKPSQASIKIIEAHLRRYRSYEAAIANSQTELDYLLPSGIISYDFTGGGGFTVRSSTENSALDRLESKRAIDLHEVIQKCKLLISQMDRAIEVLNEGEKHFVHMRYFDSMSMEEIAPILKYSVRSTYYVKDTALEKLFIAMMNVGE